MKKLEKNNKATRGHAGWRVALSGGNSNNGSQAGLTARNANNSSSNRNSNIGSHAYDTPSLRALALAKTPIELHISASNYGERSGVITRLNAA